MFESKKQAALKTIEKKKLKVVEINRVIDEDIQPQMQQLADDEVAYRAWCDGNEQVGLMERYLVAQEFVAANQVIDDSSAEKLEAAVAAARGSLSEAQMALSEGTEEVDALMATAAGGLKTNKELEARYESARRTLAAAEVDATGATAALAAEQKAVEDARAAADEAARKLEALRADNVDEAIAAAEAEVATTEAAAAAADKHLSAVQSGVSSGAGEGESDAARLAEAQRVEKESSAEAKRLKQLVTALTKQHAAAQKEVKSSSGELEKLEAALAEKEAIVTAAREQFGELDDGSAGADLQARMTETRNAAQSTKARADELQGRLSNCQFQYADPERNFDRSRVKGIVADLVRVVDPRASTALEVVAGGRLFNVVVQDEVTSAALLERGRLRKRVTIIPLDKIMTNPVPDAHLDAARRTLGGPNANTRISTALSLVGFEDEVKAAVEYVFGTAFICEDAEAARHCAFNAPNPRRTVTLDGDVFDPRGTITGGARKKGSGVLDMLAALHAAQAAAAEAAEAFGNASREYEAWRKTRAASADARRAAKVAAHEAERLRARIVASADGRMKAEVEALAGRLAEATAGVTAATERAAEAAATVKELRTAIAEAKKNHAGIVKAAQAAVKDARAAHKAALDQVKTLNANAEKRAEEVARLQVDATDVDESQLEALQAAADEAKAALEQATVTAEDAKVALATAEAQVASEQTALAKARATVEAAQDKVASCELAVKEAQARRDEASSKLKGATARVEALLEANPWIPTEQGKFGVAFTGKKDKGQSADAFYVQRLKAFDASLGVSKVQQRLETLRKAQAKAGSTLNKKALEMHRSVKEEFHALKGKRDTIENDRVKIEAVLSELDEKKKEALEATWVKVNVDLGAIFGALLPGASASLDKPPGAECIDDGLEIKVRFGGMVKALSELSGGQRSLVALSLVLAMLVFKPCPFYVLDEIDAALDLHNTKNIGQVIRSKFKGQAQFIVVSLKQGMFSNANCIFRVRFVDGISQVSRSENLAVTGGQKRAAIEAADGDENAKVTKNKARSKRTRA
jgi:structural maintenance of chromosome 2